MKSLFLVITLALTLSCSLAAVTNSQSAPSHLGASDAVDRKIKVKGGKSIERDKSKPVRKAIEAWYDLNIQAFNAKDVVAIMALRTDDFHTTTPDGKANTRADMEAYTKRLLDRIDHFISQDFEIGTIDIQGDLASADVTQKTVRMQRLLSAADQQEGLVVLYVQHTTAGLTVNENADPDVPRDMLHLLRTLIPQHGMGFRHGEENSDAHIKTTLVGSSVTIPFREGKLMLGRWQGIFLCEFDGGRERQVIMIVK